MKATCEERIDAVKSAPHVHPPGLRTVGDGLSGVSRNVPVMRQKLIEVALPLDAINAASAREKSIRHGHPSTLHLWWARRPLAARACSDLRADGRRPVGVRRRAAFGRGNEARRPAGAEEAVGSSRIGRGRAASDRKREHQGKGEAGRYNGRSRPSCCKTGQGAATSACSDEQRSSGNGGRTGAERPLPQPERDPAHGHGRDRPLGSGHRSREGSVSVSMEVIVSPGRTCCRRFNHRH